MLFLAPDLPNKVAITQDNRAITFDELTHEVLASSKQFLKLPKPSLSSMQDMRLDLLFNY